MFKKQHATRIPLQLLERLHDLLDILTQFDVYAHVNTDFLATGNNLTNPVIIPNTKNHLKSSWTLAN